MAAITLKFAALPDEFANKPPKMGPNPSFYQKACISFTMEKVAQNLGYFCNLIKV
jgi:hypothetical protein